MVENLFTSSLILANNVTERRLVVASVCIGAISNRINVMVYPFAIKSMMI